MFDNNLIFSLVLSLINTGIYIAFTYSEYKNNPEKKKQEYILLFGTTFAISFILRMLINSKESKIYSSGGGITENIVTNSSKPPF